MARISTTPPNGFRNRGSLANAVIADRKAAELREQTPGDLLGSVRGMA